MTDPRNVAHDKRVQQEKKHKGVDIAEGTTVTPQPGKKPPHDKHESDASAESTDSGAGPDSAGTGHHSGTA